MSGKNMRERLTGGPMTPFAERIPLGRLRSIWAILFQGARLMRIRYRLPYEKNLRNKPCPCGSGKKFKRCHGR